MSAFSLHVVTERTTEPNTAQTERVLTILIDPMTPRLWTAVCISQAKECLHTIHVLSLFHPVLSLLVLHAKLFVVLGFTLRADGQNGRLEQVNLVGSRFAASMWIFTKAVICNGHGQTHMHN